MGTMYIATIPACPTHGRMKWLHPKDNRGVYLPGHWVCLGWDGEGCDYLLHENDMNWTPVEGKTTAYYRK